MKELIYVGVGGFLGTISRYGIQHLFGPVETVFPLAVWLINIAGCFFLGWFFTVTPTKWEIKPELRLLIGTGFTGAFTTFSSFSVDFVHLISIGELVLALLYVVLSIVIGLLMSYIGIKFGIWMLGQGTRKEKRI
ncbi:fluoride efflux transporter CrcB [Neobacillus mesonae]|nr:fluoride efflux transporter CrcB [Neobacillus mesonae]